MMWIRKITFIDEVKDQLNNSIDIGIEFKNGFFYIIIVRTPDNSIEEMLQKSANFIKPDIPIIVIKKLAKK